MLAINMFTGLYTPLKEGGGKRSMSWPFGDRPRRVRSTSCQGARNKLHRLTQMVQLHCVFPPPTGFCWLYDTSMLLLFWSLICIMCHMVLSCFSCKGGEVSLTRVTFRL